MRKKADIVFRCEMAEPIVLLGLIVSVGLSFVFSAEEYLIGDVKTSTLIIIYLVTTAFLFFYLYIRKHTEKKELDEQPNPYVIQILPLSFDDLIEKVSASTLLKKFDNVWYSHEKLWTGIDDVICIYGNMDQYDSIRQYEIDYKYLSESIRRECGITKTNNRSVSEDSGMQINVHAFSSDTGTTPLKARPDVAYAFKDSIGILNMYIDLSAGIIYLPGFSAWYENDTGDNRYSDAVRYMNGALYSL